MSSASKSASDIDAQMEGVLDLLSKRAKGEVTSSQVEAAVSGILDNMGCSAQKQKPKQASNRNNHPTEPEIQVDESNYDDDDDDENDEIKETNKAKQSLVKQNHNEEDSSEADPVDDDNEILDAEEYEDQLSQIPLGKEGAKMMTTFGDGPRPNLQAVETALLGARKTLQLAIMDARAIRRRAKQQYEEAQQPFKSKGSKVSQTDSVDPDMLYRALSRNDNLRRQPKCGFDVEQLTWLFPEEMRSYQRWTEMHSEYKKNAEAEENNSVTTDADAAAKTSDQLPDPPLDKTEELGGHLQARAANFDVRTDKMKSEWYLKKFAKVRQGSFLPRRTRQRRTTEEIDWDEGRQNGKRGRRAEGSWEHMPIVSVRFLHWLGFDPPALCPPNDDTTQALAFLGYDMLGRIVEKRMRENQSEVDETKVLRELRKGEQLSKEDIENAMTDPDIRPASLHAIEESSQPSFQLYFGPGFEERLELEMEELVASEKKFLLSEEERRIRENEASLLSKIGSPPTSSDAIAEILGRRREEEEMEQRRPSEESSEPEGKKARVE